MKSKCKVIDFQEAKMNAARPNNSEADQLARIRCNIKKINMMLEELKKLEPASRRGS